MSKLVKVKKITGVLIFSAIIIITSGYFVTKNIKMSNNETLINKPGINDPIRELTELEVVTKVEPNSAETLELTRDLKLKKLKKVEVNLDEVDYSDYEFMELISRYYPEIRTLIKKFYVDGVITEDEYDVIYKRYKEIDEVYEHNKDAQQREDYKQLLTDELNNG